MQDYRKLDAWEKSHRLALHTYAITAAFPKAELFGLTSQMRRAAVSVPANIAEGCYRGGNRHLAQALRIAMGSAGELEYYVILASDLKLMTGPQRAGLAKETADVKRVVTGFLKAVIRSIKMANGKR
jgi:four helix bundle protein